MHAVTYLSWTDHDFSTINVVLQSHFDNLIGAIASVIASLVLAKQAGRD